MSVTALSTTILALVSDTSWILQARCHVSSMAIKRVSTGRSNLPAYLVLGFHSLPARLASERGHISHLMLTLRERAGAVGKKMQTLLAATIAPMTLIAAADCR